MKKISSAWTFFFKRIFPAAWFGFLAVFVVIVTTTGAAARDVTMLVIPVAMAVLGFFLMKSMIWSLADEVYDQGDFLLVRKGPDEERIALSNVMKVRSALTTNPPRITLKLAKPSRFGEEITFMPVVGFKLNPFARNPVVDDLIVRADRARSRRLLD